MPRARHFNWVSSSGKQIWRNQNRKHHLGQAESDGHEKGLPIATLVCKCNLPLSKRVATFLDSYYVLTDFILPLRLTSQTRRRCFLRSSLKRKKPYARFSVWFTKMALDRILKLPKAATLMQTMETRKSASRHLILQKVLARIPQAIEFWGWSCSMKANLRAEVLPMSITKNSLTYR